MVDEWLITKLTLLSIIRSIVRKIKTYYKHTSVEIKHSLQLVAGAAALIVIISVTQSPKLKQQQQQCNKEVKVNETVWHHNKSESLLFRDNKYSRTHQ